MATSVSYEGSYYSGNSSISFRSLQENFGGNSNNVKFSTYYRNTDVENTDPIVPDATENANIATSGSIDASDFRNSIKKYYITQSGGEQDYDIDNQTWNSNLGKNVLKEARLTGLLRASSTGNNAAHFNSSAFNLRIIASGGIAGHEGLGGNPKNNGNSGGPALYVNNSTGRTGQSSRVIIEANNTIGGGGGGGGGGGDGSGGSTSCYNEWGYANIVNQVIVDYGNVLSQGCRSCPSNSTSPEGFSGSYYSRNCYGSSPRDRCRGSNPKSGGGQGVRGEGCFGTWTTECIYRRNVTLTAGGGSGGNGGHGQGANRLSGPQSGGGGNSGGRAYCAANNTRATGNAGGSGGSGGSFGQKGGDGSGSGAGNGGNGGAAIYRSGGRPYDVVNTSYIKGNY